MDLWIRSQDRRILQKLDNIFLDANYENKRICSYDNDCKTELGTYKTKERALEVLDEISDLMIPTGLDENEEYTNERCFINKNMMYYQMPEE